MNDTDDTRYFIVFPARKWKNVMGETGISWDDAVGVFMAESPDQACLMAAKKTGAMSTYFAVEGFAWGLEMVEAEGSELGAKPDPISRLEAMGQRIEKSLTAALTSGNSSPQLEEGDQDAGA